MTYFFILPALLIYILVFTIFILFVAITPFRKTLVPYLWRSLVASILGVLTANIILWAGVIGIFFLLDFFDTSDLLHQLIGVPTAIGLLLGPIPMTIFGAIIGLALGVIWTRKALA